MRRPAAIVLLTFALGAFALGAFAPVAAAQDAGLELPRPQVTSTTASATTAVPQEPSQGVTLGPAARLGDSTSSVWDRVRSALGLFAMIGIAWLLSTARKDVRWRTVIWGVALQITLGVLTLTPPGQWLFGAFNGFVIQVLQFTTEGASFLFGNLSRGNNVPVGPSVVPMGDAPSQAWQDVARMAPVAQPSGAWQWAPLGAFFAFGVLPTIIFFSSLMAVAYHLGLMQRIVKVAAIVMQRTMGTSGAETLSAAGNIFVGQTEAPLLVRPFIKGMTRSELMAVMTGGFATVAGGVMMAYVGMLRGIFPDIAGHLLTASIMSAPAALVAAKLMLPEPDPTKSETFGTLKIELHSTDANVIDAAARGAAEGLQLALNVGAMLLAFIALIAMVNGMLGWAGGLVGFDGLTLQMIFGWVLAPLAWLMGVPWADAQAIGSLLGVKTVVNEFVAYLELVRVAPELVHHRSMVIATYALCGFANFSSIAIQLGGISPLAPERRGELASIGLRAMIAGSIACFMTACVIGALI